MNRGVDASAARTDMHGTAGLTLAARVADSDSGEARMNRGVGNDEMHGISREGSGERLGRGANESKSGRASAIEHSLFRVLFCPVFYFLICIRSLPTHSPLPRGVTGHVVHPCSLRSTFYFSYTASDLLYLSFSDR